MDEEKQKKIFLMKIGVAFLAGLILILWVFNLKNVWRFNQINAPTDSQADWQSIKTNLDKSISEISDRLNKENDQALAQQIASSTLLQDLVKETSKLAASSTAATTSTTSLPVSPATSTLPGLDKKTGKNCPQYIDCMPTVGSAPDCSIPVGCEGITEKVY